MDRSSFLPINPFNYEEWKMKMPIFLKRKRIFGITMGTEKKPMVYYASMYLLIFLIRSYLPNHQLKSELHWNDYLARKIT